MTPYQRLSARVWLWAWSLTTRRHKKSGHPLRKDANDG